MFRNWGCIAVAGGVPAFAGGRPLSPAWASPSGRETDAAPSFSGSDSLPRHLPGQVLCHRAQHHHRAAPSKFLGAPHEREGERRWWRLAPPWLPSPMEARPGAREVPLVEGEGSGDIVVPSIPAGPPPPSLLLPHPGVNSSPFSPPLMLPPPLRSLQQLP